MQKTRKNIYGLDYWLADIFIYHTRKTDRQLKTLIKKSKNTKQCSHLSSPTSHINLPLIMCKTYHATHIRHTTDRHKLNA